MENVAWGVGCKEQGRPKSFGVAAARVVSGDATLQSLLFMSQQ